MTWYSYRDRESIAMFRSGGDGGTQPQLSQAPHRYVIFIAKESLKEGETVTATAFKRSAVNYSLHSSIYLALLDGWAGW